MMMLSKISLVSLLAWACLFVTLAYEQHQQIEESSSGREDPNTASVENENFVVGLDKANVKPSLLVEDLDYDEIKAFQELNLNNDFDIKNVDEEGRTLNDEERELLFLFKWLKKYTPTPAPTTSGKGGSKKKSTTSKKKSSKVASEPPTSSPGCCLKKIIQRPTWLKKFFNPPVSAPIDVPGPSSKGGKGTRRRKKNRILLIHPELDEIEERISASFDDEDILPINEDERELLGFGLFKKILMPPEPAPTAVPSSKKKSKSKIAKSKASKIATIAAPVPTPRPVYRRRPTWWKKYIDLPIDQAPAPVDGSKGGKGGRQRHQRILTINNNFDDKNDSTADKIAASFDDEE